MAIDKAERGVIDIQLDQCSALVSKITAKPGLDNISINTSDSVLDAHVSENQDQYTNQTLVLHKDKVTKLLEVGIDQVSPLKGSSIALVHHDVCGIKLEIFLEPDNNDVGDWIVLEVEEVVQVDERWRRHSA